MLPINHDKAALFLASLHGFDRAELPLYSGGVAVTWLGGDSVSTQHQLTDLGSICSPVV